MREILFRGKTVKEEWVYGLLAHVGNAWYISNRAGSPLAYEVIPSTVGQYTGLTDKNGKRIFEGDILRYKNCDDEYGVLFVEFRNGSFYVNEHGVTCDPVSEALCLGIEVIGNIHDNPGLLKSAADYADNDTLVPAT